jgi:hypothetical protein
MQHGKLCVLVLGIAMLPAMPAIGGTIYNNLTPNNLMGIATRPDAGSFEIEAGDDFVLGSSFAITGASFTGILVPGPNGGATDINQVVVEIYRVFPNDSDTGRTPNVPTRANSPSDVALDSRDSAAGGLAFATSVLSATFTVNNSVQPGGIHPSPGQRTGGNGPLTGQEIQFDVTFTTPLNLPPDHYFFVPQVAASNGGQFYWLSASRPISGAGTTPILPDLQAWTRDAALDPDWLRVGTDIVGGDLAPAPTFNAAFSLDGTETPEPASATLVLAGLAFLGYRRYHASR